ncbi:MAG TPA: hypothetical protein PKZ37_14700 [Gallionellaceae bacterium]|jgi:hypothetical protein|nr:hypothetical protein [Gallionellaceae bacterium]
MKIAFIALALMLSASIEAVELPTAPLSDEQALQKKAAAPLIVEQYRQKQQQDNEQNRAQVDKHNEEVRIRAQELQEEQQRKYLINKQEEAVREAAHQAIKPKCTDILFTGVATPPPYRRVIAQVLASNDIEDTLARNPIQCRSNQFGNRECTGVDYFKNKKGKIINWDKDFYIIDTPLDFNTGRANIELSIRRIDAVCVR